MATDWSDLPSELLRLILQRLPIKDSVRFGIVCTSWHSVSAENLRRPTNQGPWLMLPGDSGPHSATRNFYCLSDGNTYKLDLPEIRGRPCVGSRDGWLVYVDKNLQLSALNPLTRAQFTIPGLLGRDEAKYFSHYKVIFSADPSSDTCTVVTIRSWCKQLAFAKLGCESWTRLDDIFYYFNDAVFDKRQRFNDAIFHKEQLYAVDGSGWVVTSDLSNPSSPKVVELLPPPVPKLTLGSYYLVELSGDILLVWRDAYFNAMDHQCHDFLPMRVYRADVFKVFKLDPGSNEWVEVKSLGDYTLFLGGNYSVALSTRKFPKLGNNCIYEHRGRGLNPETEHHDYGVYRLEKGCYEIYYVSDLMHLISPIWIVPK